MKSLNVSCRLGDHNNARYLMKHMSVCVAIKAHDVSHENIYILLATCNGKPYIRNYLTHEMQISNGVLEFQMGPKPNTEWGSKREDCPPDLMK